MSPRGDFLKKRVIKGISFCRAARLRHSTLTPSQPRIGEESAATAKGLNCFDRVSIPHQRSTDAPYIHDPKNPRRCIYINTR
jgi:hypothetical protein